MHGPQFMQRRPTGCWGVVPKPRGWRAAPKKADFLTCNLNDSRSYFNANGRASNKSPAAAQAALSRVSGGRAARCATGGQIDPRPTTRDLPARPRDMVRLGGSHRPRPFGGSGVGTPALARVGGARRNPAAARPLPLAAGTGRPATHAGTISGAWQRFPGTAPANLRDPRRAGGVPRTRWLRPQGSAGLGALVVARRLPTFLLGPLRRGESALARRVHPHLPDTRHPRTRQPGARRHPAPLLVHAGALARATLEWRRVRPRLWHLAHHRAALLGRLDLGVRRAAVAPLAREHRQAASALAQGVCERLGHPPRALGAHFPGGSRLASQGGRVLGGVRHRASHPVAGGAPGAVLPLGHPCRG